jgi:hypothetical protein
VRKIGVLARAGEANFRFYVRCAEREAWEDSLVGMGSGEEESKRCLRRVRRVSIARPRAFGSPDQESRVVVEVVFWGC